MVVFAGNHGKGASATTPANNPNVMTISATTDSDGVCGAAGPDLTLLGDNTTIPDDPLAFFSNFGPTVKIAAQGVNILPTYNGTGYAVDSGTSIASPICQRCGSIIQGAASVRNALLSSRRDTWSRLNSNNHQRRWCPWVLYRRCRCVA